MAYDFRNNSGHYDSHPMYASTASSTPSPSPHPMYSQSMYPRIGQQAPSSTPPVARLGIRVTIKPEYRITPPPQLSPQVGDIPRSNFHFDFEFEKKGSIGDPTVSKYVASGLNREAVSFAVANYGDNPTKVQEFVKGYTLLREMGFSSIKVVEALLMYDNDTDKAVAHFLGELTDMLIANSMP
ncbi:uncharacterized protein E5676_scaffold376G00700 [Cucumis melo var. makuwa]|uniref:UBA domain-containing protein n=1 Tax=Cucumis melo var. makuwa TaxID=1194695 RepID=A0A5D3C3U6_CUCMM|nr:uncharacterized protein E5676_scaffold376G00700 [Cucumis melo var. makuwa]